jgi:hypothetical protein
MFTDGRAGMFLFLYYTFRFCCKKSTLRPFIASRLGLAALIVCIARSGHAQVFETFDSSRPRFQLWHSDAKAQLSETPKTEPGVEVLDVSHGNGSFAYLIYPIQPCAIIDDLNASIRIRCAQSGLKIGFRVVFPHSTDPVTQDPLVEVILGTAIDGGGRWSTSTIKNVVSHLDARQRFLRAKYGPSVDLQDPYIDGVVLSVYSLPGTIKMQVDDLQVEGMIAPTYQAKNSIEADGRTSWSNIPVTEQLRNLQATVPRWIQYQGESLDYLKSLGFNAIVTSQANDPLVMEQAARTEMGIIAPPPDLVPTDALANNFQHVHGWLLGMALDQSHLEQTRSRVAKLTRFPPSLARPMIGEAMEMYGSYSRLSDWLAVPSPLATRVRSSKEAYQVMQSDLRPMAGRSIPLTSIVTQLPNEWIAQKAMAHHSVGGETTDTADYDLLQVRLQVYRSMIQGARGWIFRSGAPLDSGDLTSMARSQGYMGINQEIELLMPWIRASQSSWRPIELDSAEHTGAILETPNSQLAIIIASGPMDQICSVAPKTERIQVTLPVAGQLRNVLRITHGEPEIVRPQQTPKGMVVTIENPALVEQLVSVVDAKPVAYLGEQLVRLAPHLVESRLEITEQVLEIAQKTLVAQRVATRDARWEQVRRAQSLHREATQHLARSNLPLALKAADQALLASQRVVRTAWDEATAQFIAFQSSPLIASPLSLPLHIELNRLLAGRAWQSIAFPDTPFRNTEEFYRSRWRVDRRLNDTVQSDCLVGGLGPDGLPSLVLATRPIQNQPIPSGYAGAAMRVSSPPLAAPIGSMVHIEGLVKIESHPGETQSGLLVCDSLGGETLGQLISSVDPSQYEWRRFELFRFVTQAEGVRLHFETRGQMQATVSGLKAETIVPAQPAGLPTRTYDPDEISVGGALNSIPISAANANATRQPN